MRTVNPQGFNEDDDLYFKNFKQTQYSGHKKIPTSLGWSPLGDKLVIAQTYVKIWNFDLIYGCEKTSQAKLHQNNVDHVKFGSNNLFGTLSKQSLRFWDIRQSPLKSKKQEKKNKFDFISFCWNLTGPQLQNASENDLKYCLLTKDNTITFNDYRVQNKPLKVINFKDINNMDITQIGWDQSNSFFLCAGGENSTGSIILLNGQNFEQIPDGQITSHCGRINHFAICPTNNFIATASDDSLVQIHQFPQFICQRSYSNKMDNSYQKISFNHNGKYMAVASDGNSIDIFNTQYGGWANRINTQIQRPIIEWNPKRQIVCYIDEKRKISKNQKVEDCYINILQTQI